MALTLGDSEALPCAMPSTRHEGVVLLFRNRPELVGQLLREQLGLKLAVYGTATVVAADLTAVTPTERRADLVVMLEGPEGKLAVVVEVQLDRDDRKHWSWPAYLAELRAREKCAVLLLVVTPEAAVAEWAARRVELGPGSVMTPWVLGPKEIPATLELTAAQQSPELAVLSVVAHGAAANAVELATVALQSVGGLDDDRARTYLDLVLAALSEAARRALEDLMQNGYEYQSDFAKKYVAQGRAEGEAAGEAKGEARAVLAVLRSREVVVDAAAEKRITACADLAELDRWIARAAKVARVEELFSPAEPKKKSAAKKSPKKRAR